MLGVAFRYVDPVTFDVVWEWAPMREPRSAEPMREHRPGPVAFQLNAAESADAPPVVALCKNGSHPRYHISRLSLAGRAEKAFESASKRGPDAVGRLSVHLGEESATDRSGRATRVQRGTSKAQ
jgi:hypothetical protein